MSTTANQPVKQHTVPRFWLRHFLDQGEDQLFAYRRNGRHSRVSPKIATVVEHFYTLRRKDNSPVFDIENALAKLENDCAPAFSKLVNSGVSTLNADEKGKLAVFFAFQIKRNVRNRAYYDDAFQHWNTREQWLAYLDENENRFVELFSRGDFDDFKSDVANGRILENDPNLFLTVSLLHPPERLARSISRMHWRTEKCKHADSFFVVGDVPLVVRRRGRWLQRSIVGIERDDLDAELYIPLSLERMLIASWKKPRELTKKVGKMRVDELNTVAIVACHKTVYSPKQSSKIRSMMSALKNFDIKMGIPESLAKTSRKTR